MTLYNYSPTVGTVLTATIAPANATATILWYRDDNVYLAAYFESAFLLSYVYSG